MFSPKDRRSRIQENQLVKNSQGRIEHNLRRLALNLQKSSAQLKNSTKWKILIAFVVLSVSICSYLTYNGVNADISGVITPIMKPAFVIIPNNRIVADQEQKIDLLKLQFYLDSLTRIQNEKFEDSLLIIKKQSIDSINQSKINSKTK